MQSTPRTPLNTDPPNPGPLLQESQERRHRRAEEMAAASFQGAAASGDAGTVVSPVRRRRLINDIYTSSFKPQSLPTSKVFNDDLLIFLECLAVYIEIYDGLHGVSHPSARRAMKKFSSFLLHQGQIYQAHRCISMGLTLLLA
ncbi:hypothetical protein DHEL01_v212712 [Diaporthe helianthi]|uniref:Uncharacterized protein n=1 Tax=Diaporthe helianthi TaxID=158607 RepID=A0A2P5HF61_DIAHE|nr:hypothetical protein DHEL01_v212712 [Diaporthe helianthi]